MFAGINICRFAILVNYLYRYMNYVFVCATQNRLCIESVIRNTFSVCPKTITSEFVFAI